MARKPWLILCTRCHEKCEAEWVVPGSSGTELLLYFLTIPFLCVGGVAYSGYRHAKEHWACPVCGSKQVVPINSRRARAILGNDDAAG